MKACANGEPVLKSAPGACSNRYDHTKRSALYRPSAVGSPGKATIYHKVHMAAQLAADAVIVQGAQPQSQPAYWQYPKTSGIAINTQTDPPSLF